MPSLREKMKQEMQLTAAPAENIFFKELIVHKIEDKPTLRAILPVS